MAAGRQCPLISVTGVVPALHLDLEHLARRIGRDHVDDDLPVVDELRRLDRVPELYGDDRRRAVGPNRSTSLDRE